MISPAPHPKPLNPKRSNCCSSSFGILQEVTSDTADTADTALFTDMESATDEQLLGELEGAR